LRTGYSLKLKDLGEFNLINRIRQQTTDGAGVRRGIGDDAAVVSIPSGHDLLTSTDMLIEGIHFRQAWTSPKDLGHKAVAVNLSDIAAMGGTPRYIYLGLACPGETSLRDITAFMDGALAEAERHNVTLVGGDTCRSPGPWIISVTIEGSTTENQAIGRDGAHPGDRIMVSGSLGDSALALHLLCAGEHVEAPLAERHHRPSARVDLGRKLGEEQLATAMIDISDGLASDLEHLLRASQAEALVIENKLPRSTFFQHHVDKSPALAELVLYGGEDYELLFTVAPENAAKAIALGAQMGVPVTEIGSVRQGSGAFLLENTAGDVCPVYGKGFDHFQHP
jgi:thiamine-monophosphate kinase